MGIAEKIVRNVKGVINDLVEGSTDPGTEARQLLRDMDEAIEKANSKFVDVKATYVLLEKKRDKAQEEVEKWQKNAQLAVDKGDDKTAKDCLEAKRKHETVLKDNQQQMDKLKPQIDLLEKRIKDLKAKRDDMASKTDLLAARGEIAEAQRMAGTILDDISSTDVSSEFSKLEQRVEKSEARVQVMTEQADQNSGKDLEDRVASLSNTMSVDDELASMKSKKTS